MTPFALLEKGASSALEDAAESLRRLSGAASTPRRQLDGYWKHMLNPFGSMSRISEEGRGGAISRPFTLLNQTYGFSLGSLPILAAGATRGGGDSRKHLLLKALIGGFLGAGGGGMWAQKKHNDRARQDLERLRDGSNA